MDESQNTNGGITGGVPVNNVGVPASNVTNMNANPPVGNTPVPPVVGTNPMGPAMSGVGTNPMMGMTNPATPVNTGTGDIVLTPDKKKSKKGLVIGIVLVLLLLIGGAVAAVMMMGGGNGIFGGGEVSEKTKNEFNRFANYVLYGEINDGVITGDYSPIVDYYFETHQNTEEQQSELFEQTTTLLDQFEEQYKNGNNEELNQKVKKEGELLTFIKEVYTKKAMNSSIIAEKYAENGKAATLDFVDSYYDFSDTDNNEYLAEFKATYEPWTQNVIRMMEVYSYFECLVGAVGSDLCVDGKADDEQKESISEIKASITEDWGILYQFYYMSDDFEENVFIINDLMNGNASSSQSDEATELQEESTVEEERTDEN